MSYGGSARPEKADLTSLVVYAKQAIAEITQKTYFILIRSELMSKNNNLVFTERWSSKGSQHESQKTSVERWKGNLSSAPTDAFTRNLHLSHELLGLKNHAKGREEINEPQCLNPSHVTLSPKFTLRYAGATLQRKAQDRTNSLAAELGHKLLHKCNWNHDVSGYL